VRVVGRRRAVSVLVVGLLVVGTALLVQSQVEGQECDPCPSAEGHEESGGSRMGTLLGPVRPSAASAPAQSLGLYTKIEAPTASSTPTPEPSPLPTATPLPMPTPDGTPRQLVIPILMYHHIAVPGPNADAIRRDLSVSPANFEAQLGYLVEHGYEPITLESLILHLQVGSSLPPKPVILTFDDGFKDHYTNAYPLLKRYGFTGTFFVITGFVDEGRPGHMSWPEIELLHANGMEIGSHTYTHPSLAGKSFDYIVWQVLGSKEAIEARTQEPLRFFCYPSGQYDQQVVDVLQSAGYWGAVTVEAGSLQASERPFELKRIRVRGAYDLEDFDHWLNYWLANP
jgi:peptidoglycan/xylan/chitin deacetylase (PgdA/CDA1 family)